MGWTEDQFWSSTPRMLSLAIEAYRRKQEASYERAAWTAAAIINHMPAFSKRRPPPVTPAQLLGKKTAAVDAGDFENREAWREYMRRQLERVEDDDEEV